jgi:transcription elongation GreA/GreB family factor
MSKAFTKEDDDAGFSAPSSSSITIPGGPFRITPRGARLAAAHADPRVRDALARAEVLTPAAAPERAALGVTVRVETSSDESRSYRLVSPEERALVGEGCSVGGPIGRALLGATVGETREVALPGREPEELVVVALTSEA